MGNALEARLEDQAQCILVIIGATPEGKKELVGFTDGMRESAQSWRDLLLDLKRRGLSVAPELAVADGALGFWKALGEVWPTTREQRCWVHKIWLYVTPTFNIVHLSCGADRTPNYLVLIEHRELQDHPIEVVTLDLASLQRQSHMLHVGGISFARSIRSMSV